MQHSGNFLSIFIKKVIILTTFSWVFTTANSQIIFDPIQPPKRATPAYINTQFTIDGRLNETAWEQAQAISGFYEVNPNQGAKPSQRTVVKVAYNNSYLYVAAICYDDNGKSSLRVPDFKRDFDPSSHDLFAIMVDGFKDGRNAMAFLVNPYGVQRDVLCFDDRFFDVEWDALWQVRTQRSDSGWVAEVAIPFKTLRYPQNANTLQTWGINFCRQRRSTNEYYTWSPFPRAYSLTRMSYEGFLDSLKVPSSRTNIRLQPYNLVSFTKKENRWNTTVKAGGEAKWAISSNKVLDLTFNTDFAQADADQQVNNIQRFSYFFPERRQFFLENASMLRTGLDANPDGNKLSPMTIQPFFSRRIGLDAYGQIIPIQAGARYIQRSADFNIGLMALRQDALDTLPPADFFIGRYTHNIGRQNTIGALITSRVQEGGGVKHLQYTNWSGTVDGFFRVNQQLQVSGMASGTFNSGKAGSGLAGYGQLFYRNDFITAWWNQSFVTPGYNPEIGFVSRSNVICTSPGFYVVARSKWLPKSVRSFGPALLGDIVHTAGTGKLEEINASAYPFWFSYHNGGYTGFSIDYQYQRLRADFHPLKTTISPGAYSSAQVHFKAGSDPSKKWGVSAEYYFGSFYNGRITYGIINNRLSPLPHLVFNGILERYTLRNVGIYTIPADYYLYTFSTRLSFNPRIQAYFLFQKNTAEKTTGFNARFSWEYSPLSYFYIVFNNRTWTQNNIQQSSAAGIIKLSYLKQF